MPVAVEVTSDSAPADYYEGLKMLGTGPAGSHPDTGCLFHWMTETDDGGWRVVDVWETREQAEAFIQGKVGPVMQELGASEPQIRFVEVSNYLTAGG